MDDIDVHDVIATHTPKGKSPKLDRYADAIFYLKERGFSDDDVLLFLSEKKGLVVGKRTLSRFLARDKKEKPAQNTIKSTAPKPETEQPERLSTPAQFNWQEDIDVNELI